MRHLLLVFLLAVSAFAQTDEPKLPAGDAIRINEFYRVAGSVQDQIWPGWSKVPAPLMLVTPAGEFLTHHPSPPKEWKKVGDDVYAGPHQFPVTFQATFPVFGSQPVIVIGAPENTASKYSTPWLFTVMHEHFHQLQYAQPGYFESVNALGLSHGDGSGMWMLNYPFPYEKPETTRAFAQLRNLLLLTVNEKDAAEFQKLAKRYIELRKKFFGQLSPDDHKYFSFQLWQEGIARYTEVKSAEAGARYQPTAEFAALADFEPFSDRAAKARTETLHELQQADLATWKRTVVYSFGAAEGFLLDRLHPNWKDEYFRRMLSMDSFFEPAQ